MKNISFTGTPLFVAIISTIAYFIAINVGLPKAITEIAICPTNKVLFGLPTAISCNIPISLLIIIPIILSIFIKKFARDMKDFDEIDTEFIGIGIFVSLALSALSSVIGGLITTLFEASFTANVIIFLSINFTLLFIIVCIFSSPEFSQEESAGTYVKILGLILFSIIPSISITLVAEMGFGFGVLTYFVILSAAPIALITSSLIRRSNKNWPISN